ncbi:hypothetical protein K3G63_22435 [Hymenobacter sp. HSC-4F20]|uniref:hypothetical protein n=1 Tax=Hymenobacter sp. HSC-4F20 TaxID=2864135 RepID=UPI001C72AA7E|nr:hypothetical protein [Hymenobacter sp. HSC-4F20]MBX0293220.1 hypothetical protein [Hymenobacter sp. HSC-4F20]
MALDFQAYGNNGYNGSYITFTEITQANGQVQQYFNFSISNDNNTPISGVVDVGEIPVDVPVPRAGQTYTVYLSGGGETVSKNVRVPAPTPPDTLAIDRIVPEADTSATSDNGRATVFVKGITYTTGGVTGRLKKDGEAWQNWTNFSNYKYDGASLPFENLGPGHYSVEVMGGNSPRVLQGEFTIVNSVAILAIDHIVVQPDSAITGDNGSADVFVKSVSGATITATVTGRIKKDGGNWQNWESFYNHNDGTSNAYNQASHMFQGLAAGTYAVEVQISDGQPTLTGTFIIKDTVPVVQVGDQLSFIPWVKSKLTQVAQAVQGSARPAITLRLTATSRTNAGSPTEEHIEKTAEVYGPGDVLGINPDAILDTNPNPNETQFSSLQLASIEFKEEDLPWRYSPTGATSTQPWLFLLVLEEGEYTLPEQNTTPLPLVRVPVTSPVTDKPVFPAVDQQSLWAHVQAHQALTAADMNEFLNTKLKERPELAYSRVFSPRRLAAGKRYRAFLLPAFEAGRLAGLGQQIPSGVSSNTSAWDGKTGSVDFPVYYDWEFQTSATADFESLVRQLQPVAAAATAPLGNILVDTGREDYLLDMPGVLVPEVAGIGEVEAEVAQYLYDELKPGFVVTPSVAGQRPVVTPPLYGRSYLNSAGLSDPRTSTQLTTWPEQVNLDPRYRLVASLGAQLVQDKQQDFVERAWEQVRDVLLANQKLRGAQFGLRTTKGLRQQHLPVTITTLSAGQQTKLGGEAETAGFARMALADAPAAAAPAPETLVIESLDNYGLHLTGMALDRVRPFGTGLTARQAIRESNVPVAAFSPAFRRITKPFGRYQVGQAGRPLRPTQPETTPAARTLVEPGTSLRQRDELLTLLQRQTVQAAAPRREALRLSQFNDQAVDQLLRDEEGGSPLPLRVLRGKEYQAVSETMQQAFSEAFGEFKAGVMAAGFETVRPRLPFLNLDAVKGGVLLGTQPERVFLSRVGDAGGAQVPLPVLPGDWAAEDFEAPDFLLLAEEETTTKPSEPPLMATLSRKAESSEAALRATSAEASFAAASAEDELAAALLPVSNSRAALRPAPGEVLLKPVMAYPVFPDALGELLRKSHPDLFLPNIENFPANSITQLEVNQAFIEAFMLGANHALGSELLWREYPTDMRGSYFQQFWDVSEHQNMHLDDEPTAAEEEAYLDVQPLDQWANPLGGNRPPEARSPNLMLAIRSDLVRLYPNLVICAQAAHEVSGVLQPDETRTVYPTQRLNVGQDMVTVNFELPLAEARGTGQGTDLGYFLVFMERPGQPQFGLDASLPPNTAATDDPATWNDFSWPYLATEEGDNIDLGNFASATKPHVLADPKVPYVRNSAQLAYALFQQPIMASVHAAELL